MTAAGGSSTERGMAATAAMEIGRLSAVIAIGVFALVLSLRFGACEANRGPDNFILGR